MIKTKNIYKVSFHEYNGRDLSIIEVQADDFAECLNIINKEFSKLEVKLIKSIVLSEYQIRIVS